MTPARRTVSILSVLGMLAALPLAARSQVAAARYAITIDGYEVAVVEEGGEATGEIAAGGHRFLRDFLAGRSDRLITEVGIPALDRELRRPVKLSVKLRPEYTRQQKHAELSARQTVPSLSFRLTGPGLDGSAVTAIDPFTVKRIAKTQPHKVDGESIREKHRPEIEVLRPAAPDFEVSDLVLRLSPEAEASWLAWQASGGEKKNLRLELLDGDRVLVGFDLLGAQAVERRRRTGRRETYLVVKLEQVLISG